MDDMLPFLREIAESPDDDAPRLVFSDWLEEHGHQERAELIREQIALARMDAGDEGYAERTARMRRCGVFTKKGKHPFFDHLPGGKGRIAFGRGFIESISTEDAETIDDSGFDLIPLRSLRTAGARIEHFKRFKKLKRLEYQQDRDAPPADLLKLFGARGWFRELEELCLPNLDRAALEAGVIPRFDLPRLRNFYLSTAAFYNLEAASTAPAGPGEGEDEDDYYSRARPWAGLAGYLPANAIPGPKCPLERFIWHSHDDCDYFNDEDWYWRGPTMESLLEHLRGRGLKQIEVVVDYDDHESGAEGVIAAPYRRSPLESCPTLERVTLDDGDLRLLDGAKHKLKALRVYGTYDVDEFLFTLLGRPVCSELESLHVDGRGGWWGDGPLVGPAINFPKLKYLNLAGPLGPLSGCDFPALLTLEGYQDLKVILARRWERLQNLTVGFGDVAEMKAFAKSDCCPSLTTLNVSGYDYSSAEVDVSPLAKCPHMPHLSLIRIPHYSRGRAYIVDKGKLLPVRGDVMLEEQKPELPFRVSAAF